MTHAMGRAAESVKKNRRSTLTDRYPTQDCQPAVSTTGEHCEQRDDYESAGLPGQEFHATRPCWPFRKETPIPHTRARKPAYVMCPWHPSPPQSAAMPKHAGTKPIMSRNRAERRCSSAHEPARIPTIMHDARPCAGQPLCPTDTDRAVRVSTWWMLIEVGSGCQEQNRWVAEDGQSRDEDPPRTRPKHPALGLRGRYPSPTDEG